MSKNLVEKYGLYEDQMENGREEEHEITWKEQKEGNGEGVEYIYRPKFVL